MTPNEQSRRRQKNGMPRRGPKTNAHGMDADAGDEAEGDDPAVPNGV